MLVFISRQKFLRLRLQLNLIKVKPALGEYGQRGWQWAWVARRGEEGRWSAWYSYRKSDFIIIFNFWFTAHFERVPPSSNSLSLPLYLLLLMLLSLSLSPCICLSFFAAHAQLIMSLCACVLLKMPARPTPAAGSTASHCPLPALHSAVLAWALGSQRSSNTKANHTHTHTHQMMLIFTHSNNNNNKWSCSNNKNGSQHQIVATLR